MLAIGERAPDALLDARVEDPDGAKIRLGDAWAGAPSLTLFLRHFGCAACRARVEGVTSRLPELEALGVATFLVGCGTAAQAKAFHTRRNLDVVDVTLLTDPTLAAQRAAGLLRSAWGAFGVVPVLRSGKLLLEGHPTRLPEGDTSQQGGTLLLDRRATVRFYHRSARLGDDAPLADVLDVALAMSGEGSLLP